MNTQYFLYAIEVEKTGSITQAANNLFMGQPTLSKAIKDLESSLGFQVFQRTSRGVAPTAKGEEFLTHAKKIAAQLRKMDQALRTQEPSGQLFSLAISRVDYMARAAAEFAATFGGDADMEVDLLEANSGRVIDAVAYGHFVLGVLRCHGRDLDDFQRSLEEKGLRCEQIWQGRYAALMRRDHPLAGKEALTAGDLEPYVEIAYADEEPLCLGAGRARATGRRHILVYDRATCLELVRAHPQAYLWGSPMPEGDLTAKPCAGGGQFRDLLISRAGYRFSRLDRAFIDRLYLRRNQAAYGD